MKIVFGTYAEFVSWRDSIDPNRYIVYVTDNNEIYVRPKTSTRSLDTGYIALLNRDDVNAAVAALKERGFKIFKCAAVELVL